MTDLQDEHTSPKKRQRKADDLASSSPLFPGSFCKVVPDLLTGSEEHCVANRSNSVGTKCALAYIHWKRTGDTSVWRGIAHDALTMSLDDLYSAGVTGNLILSCTVSRNRAFITDEVIAEIEAGAADLTQTLRRHGINVSFVGVETSDVGDLVRTLAVDCTATARLRRDEVIDNSGITAGNVVVGLASYGQATYEAIYNSGIGSTGLTAARRDVLSQRVVAAYPESIDPGAPGDLAFTGALDPEDKVEVEGRQVSLSSLLLSPARCYTPIIRRLLQGGLRSRIKGMVHCTQGGQTRVLDCIDGLHVLKDSLFSVPPLFGLLRKHSKMPWEQMYRTFNMGHRLEVYTDLEAAKEVIDIAKSFGIDAKVIGSVQALESGGGCVTVSSEGRTFRYTKGVPRLPRQISAFDVTDDLSLPTTRRRLVDGKRYNIIAAPNFEPMARRLQALAPLRFNFFPTIWEKFPDSGTDKIEIGGFSPVNMMQASHVLFLADFHCNDAVMSQFHALIALSESFLKSLTIALPYYPHGTMERVEREGEVATANTIARLLSNLPNCGGPNRVMIYDIHALQNRFYLHGNAIASLHTTVPLLLRYLKVQKSSDIGPVTAIAFPDDGATKRFGKRFLDAGFPLLTCGKVRDGEKRMVKITEGDCLGHHVLVVDDLTRSGGTLFECGRVLLASGATAISAFVAHAAFPLPVSKKFSRNGGEGGRPGEYSIFHQFITTNSNPSVTDSLPGDDAFVVLDLLPQLIEDLG